MNSSRVRKRAAGAPQELPSLGEIDLLGGRGPVLVSPEHELHGRLEPVANDETRHPSARDADRTCEINLGIGCSWWEREALASQRLDEPARAP